VSSPRTIWLVQEYIEGVTLESVIDLAGSLSERRTRTVAAELACAVGHIHSLGILHRDLKVMSWGDQLGADEVDVLVLSARCTVFGVSLRS
jgi:serine/threonine protein kinase